MKRKKYLNVLMVASIIFYTTWVLVEVSLIIIDYINPYYYSDIDVSQYGQAEIIFDIESGYILASSIGLSVVLIYSLRRIRSHTKTLVA